MGSVGQLVNENNASDNITSFVEIADMRMCSVYEVLIKPDL